MRQLDANYFRTKKKNASLENRSEISGSRVVVWTGGGKHDNSKSKTNAMVLPAATNLNNDLYLYFFFVEYFQSVISSSSTGTRTLINVLL